jgi:hypothetical protein
MIFCSVSVSRDDIRSGRIPICIPGFRLESTQRETFADFPAFSIAYSMSPKGIQFAALQITTLVGTTAYSAIYSSAPKTYKRYLVDGGLIVRSFQLT